MRGERPAPLWNGPLRFSGILFFPPAPALFEPFSIVPLLFIVGKLMEQFAGEVPALPAMPVPLALTAGFHRTTVPPKGLVHMYAAGTAYLALIGTLDAQQPASGFYHLDASSHSHRITDCP